jgi:hypothetical protein
MPTPSPSTASYSSPRSSDSLARRRSSRRARLRPSITTNNRARRVLMAALAVTAMEKEEVVAVGCTRRPMTTPASTVVVVNKNTIDPMLQISTADLSPNLTALAAAALRRVEEVDISQTMNFGSDTHY